MTATPYANSEFIGWSGALESTTSSITLTMNSDQAVTATFDLLPTVPTYTLTTIVSPTVGGTVTPNPPGPVYAENTPVQLTANPAQGYEFIRWTGDLISTTNPITITMTRDMTVTATFKQSGFDIYLPLVLRNN